METFPEDWKQIVHISKDLSDQITQRIDYEYKAKTIFPKREEIFEALKLCSKDKTKVVIIGQDPYINFNQAHGLAFSVLDSKIPPSLINIFKEIKRDINIECKSGNLSVWAKQGVLLLNTYLTTVAFNSMSHEHIPWNIVTGAIIRELSKHKQNLVFMLWGKPAQKTRDLIQNKDKHLILETSHPSPFSVHRGFLGCSHFSKCNEYLTKSGHLPIDWST
jgi:uracil-DNA glycosylase